MAKSDNNGEKKQEESRAEILNTIKNPLVFFALALLVVEASLAFIVSSSRLTEDHTFWSVIIMALLFLVVVTVVTFLTYFVPKNLMAQLEDVVRSEARQVSEAATKAVFLSQIRQNLKRLKYDLGSFDKEYPIDSLQENRREKGLTQNIFKVYVEPVIEEILGNAQLSSLIDQKKRKKLEELLSVPKYSVEDVLVLIDEILGRN